MGLPLPKLKVCVNGATRLVPPRSVTAVVTVRVNVASLRLSAGTTRALLPVTVAAPLTAFPSAVTSSTDPPGATVSVEALTSFEKMTVSSLVLRSYAAETTRGPEQSMRNVFSATATRSRRRRRC